MIPSLMPLLLQESRQDEVRPFHLASKDEELESVSEVMSLIASEFTRHAKRSMPFLARYHSSLLRSR